MARILAFLFILLPTFTYAQNYPDFESVYVNDYASVIDAQTEKRLINQLKSLRKEHGVEATILTIDSRKNDGDNTSIESFATTLFNKWGIGNADNNDGILILVVRGDREMRVELGSGYGSGFNRAAKETIDDYFLPSFRKDNYAEGIERGTSEIIRRIALPFAEGRPEPAKSEHSGKTGTSIAIFLGMIGFVFFALRRKIGDFMVRFKRCPNCGRKGLHRNRITQYSATRTTAGQGKSTTTCDYCDYYKTDIYIIPRLPTRSSSSSGSFGGGSSSGGGASGRW